jgi:hypothetical protein
MKLFGTGGSAVALYFFVFIYLLGVFFYGLSKSAPLLIIIILMTFVPFVVYTSFFYYYLENKDKISENRILLSIFIAFLLFILSIIAEGLEYVGEEIIFFQIFPNNDDWFYQRYLILFILTGIVAFSIPALIEEFAKFVIFFLSSLENPKEIHPKGLVIISLIGALSIGTIENNEYILSSFHKSINSEDAEDNTITSILIALIIQVSFTFLQEHIRNFSIY